jgi:hypothetical protein
MIDPFLGENWAAPEKENAQLKRKFRDRNALIGKAFFFPGASRPEPRAPAWSVRMVIRRKYSAGYSAPSPLDAAAMAQAHLAHVALLREVRAHHEAITLKLQSLYDSVAAESIPDNFLNLLKDETEEVSG